MAASEHPHRIIEVIRELISETGAVNGRNRRGWTPRSDAVARQDTATQLIATIPPVGREVPGAADLVQHCTGHDYTRPGKPRIA